MKFDLSRDEFDHVLKIARRAEALFEAAGINQTFQDTVMDVSACHANGTPLMLAELSEAKGYDFAHDILGIRRHIDRNNGKLLNCFVPRYAKQ